MSEITRLATIEATTELLAARDRLSYPEKIDMAPVLDLLLKDQSVPASSSLSNHGGFPGGLIVHTHRVWKVADAMAQGAHQALMRSLGMPSPLVGDPAHLEMQISSLDAASIFRVAVIHDLNKVRDFQGNPYYVPNILKGGKISEAKPWVINKEAGALPSLLRSIESKMGALLPTDAVTVAESWWSMMLNTGGIQIRDGAISLALAKQVSPTLELSADEISAVLFHDGAYAGRSGLQDNESALQIVLHAADMIASRLLC